MRKRIIIMICHNFQNRFPALREMTLQCNIYEAPLSLPYTSGPSARQASAAHDILLTVSPAQDIRAFREMR